MIISFSNLTRSLNECLSTKSTIQLFFLVLTQPLTFSRTKLSPPMFYILIILTDATGKRLTAIIAKYLNRATHTLSIFMTNLF